MKNSYYSQDTSSDPLPVGRTVGNWWELAIDEQKYNDYHVQQLLPFDSVTKIPLVM